MNATIELPKLLTSAQAAEYLGKSRRTLEGWRCRGGGPQFVRVNGQVWYSALDLYRWLKEQSEAEDGS